MVYVLDARAAIEHPVVVPVYCYALVGYLRHAKQVHACRAIVFESIIELIRSLILRTCCDLSGGGCGPDDGCIREHRLRGEHLLADLDQRRAIGAHLVERDGRARGRGDEGRVIGCARLSQHLVERGAVSRSHIGEADGGEDVVAIDRPLQGAVRAGAPIRRRERAQARHVAEHVLAVVARTRPHALDGRGGRGCAQGIQGAGLAEQAARVRIIAVEGIPHGDGRDRSAFREPELAARALAVERPLQGERGEGPRAIGEIRRIQALGCEVGLVVGGCGCEPHARTRCDRDRAIRVDP